MEKFRREGDYSSETCQNFTSDLIVFTADVLTATITKRSKGQAKGQAVSCLKRTITRNYFARLWNKFATRWFISLSRCPLGKVQAVLVEGLAITEW